VFAPYTGIKTNLLFFTKKPESEHPATSHIWFYEHPYPQGVTSYNKTKPMRFEEFQPEIDWWGDEADGFKARVENQHAWRVSIDQIKATNYNLDLKNPHAVEESHGEVDHLLPEYEKLLSQIASTRARLKNELQRALAPTSGSAE